MKAIHKKAYAKINLCLDVLRRRDDGYHDLRMIMQNVGIYDELEFICFDNMEEKRQLLGEQYDTEKISMEANKPGIPVDDKNLIIKAVKLLYDTYGLSNPIHVRLVKNIPVEAGMAGGSTDCAATFHAVNELFDLKLDSLSLRQHGVKLGADVPYCILGQTALSEGIGDILTPVEPLADCHILVAKPPVSVSTGMVYKNLKLDESVKHPDVNGMLESLVQKDVSGVAGLMGNVLETVTARLHPEIEEMKNDMIENGAINALMSGSGPTVFGIFTDMELAKKAEASIKKYTQEIFLTGPVSN